jgi:catechol 2,3-dioxygenase-like lactoylglutathione lyase family enzyme
MLGKPMLVMLNRGGQSRETGRAAAAAIGLPVVGEDPGDLLVTDGGNAMIGFGFRVTPEDALNCKCCSRRFLGEVPVDENPASEMVLVPHSLDVAARRIADTTGRPLAEFTRLITTARENQRQMSLFDVNGNLTTFTRPTNAVITGAFGDRLRGLLRRRGLDIERRRSGRRRREALDLHPDTPTFVVGFTLVVSDMAASERFYREVLGLPVLRRDRKVSFDAGPLILRIQAERYLGQVKRQSERGLLKDQLIFYVREIKKEVDFLTRSGVKFPEGIEGSVSAGFVAYFADPDGHNLWLWEPPTAFRSDMPINYFPVLERILLEHG